MLGYFVLVLYSEIAIDGQTASFYLNFTLMWLT